ncbi:MAG TPA: tetratricopeptide repeat protein, partial [Candidatus Bathyarchaeia archaeon]|nr:tetratricopeptide repeat protein [Candidatus Bathyarchaeia archaeon]
MTHVFGHLGAGRALRAAAVLGLLGLALPLRAAESPTTFIAGRVLSIAADGKTLVVNRGRAEKVIPGSDVIVRPNRGVVSADIEWDLVYAKGVIDSVDEERSTVRLTEVREPLQVRDYCQIGSGLPESLFESDLGRIAFYDVLLVDRVKERPLFTLKELAADPSPKALEAITRRILDEIRSTPADVINAKYRLDVVRTGPFVGQPLRDAFAKATLKDVTRFIEYTASFAGGRVGYTWPLIDLYADWAFTGAPSGEREKKARLASPLVDKAGELLAKGDLQGSLAEYRNALAVDPDNAAAQSRIKTVTAVLERRKALEDDPKDVAARRALGIDLFGLKLYEESLAELLKARDLGEDSAEVASYIGYAQAALNHYAEARQTLEPLAARFPDDAGVRKWLDFVRQNEVLAAKGADVAASLAIGDIKLGEGEWDEAIRRYNEALDLAPRDASIWERITRAAARRRAAREKGWAESYWKNGEFENALTCWQTALDIVRGIPDRDAEIALLKDMAALKHDSGQFAEAIEDYQAILVLDPKDAATEINAARACDGLGQHAEAERWARSGIAKSPADAWGYNVLGTIQENAGQIDQAMASYRKAVEIKTTYKDPLYNLGVLTARRGEYEAAGEIFRRVLGIDASYSSARDRLVEVEAVLECRGLLRQAPGDEGVRRRLVKALFELEDYVRTAAELKDLVAAPDPPAWALEMEGKRLVRQGRFAEGRASLEKSLVKVQNPDVAAWVGYTRAQELLAAAPDDPQAQVNLGDDSFYWGSYDAAMSAWGKAQELGAAQSEVLERMERARKGLEAQRLLNLGTDAYNRAQYENALDAARRSESLYVEIGARRGRIEALLRAGWSQAALYRHDEALKAYQEAGRIAGEIGDDGLAAKVLITLGGYYSGIGEYEKALQASEQAADLWHRANDFLNEAWSALPTIGRIKGRLGDTAAERACYAKALAIHQRIVYPWGEASCQISLASTLEWEGDFAGAIDAYAKALAIAKSLDHRPAALDAYAGLETIYARIGDVANARKYGRLFLELAQAMGRKWERANALNKLGLIELENVKDFARAREYFVESRDLARLIGDRVMEGVALANMAVVLSRQGNYREALAGEEEALRLVREVKDKFLEMQGLNEKGETHLGLKEYDAALDCQVKAREIATFLGARAEQ